MKVIPWFDNGPDGAGDCRGARHRNGCLRRSDGRPVRMHGGQLKTSPLKDLRVWLNPPRLGCGPGSSGLSAESCSDAPGWHPASMTNFRLAGGIGTTPTPGACSAKDTAVNRRVTYNKQRMDDWALPAGSQAAAGLRRR